MTILAQPESGPYNFLSSAQADKIGKKRVYAHYFNVIFGSKTLEKTLKAHILIGTNALLCPLSGKITFICVVQAFKHVFLLKSALQNFKRAHFNA